MSGASHARVHHGNMDRAACKVWDGVAQDERGGHYILRWNAVTQVHDLNVGIDRGDDAFHDSHERVFVAEVGR